LAQPPPTHPDPHAPRIGRSWSFAGQLAGLLHPGGELRFVELVVLADVEVAHVLVLGLAGGHRTQRRAAEERHFDVLREAMIAEEPALALDAIERRVPLHGLAHAGNGARDERVEAAADVAFPARHGRDVGLHGGVAVALCDLRVAACEEFHRPGGGLLCDLCRLLGRLAGHCLHSSACYDCASFQLSSFSAALTSPCQDHFGMCKPSGTSSAEWWYRDIVVVVAHVKWSCSTRLSRASRARPTSSSARSKQAIARWSISSCGPLPL